VADNRGSWTLSVSSAQVNFLNKISKVSFLKAVFYLFIKTDVMYRPVTVAANTNTAVDITSSGSSSSKIMSLRVKIQNIIKSFFVCYIVGRAEF
jgi:hypothetical protein